MAVTNDAAEMFKEQMAKPDLVFVTHENKEKLERLGVELSKRENENKRTETDSGENAVL